MTASTRARSSSACQRGTPWPPIVATARRASRSSSEPGNVMTPTRGAETVTDVSRPVGAHDAVILDHGIRQDAPRDLVGLRTSLCLPPGVHLESDVLAHPHPGHVRP